MEEGDDAVRGEGTVGEDAERFDELLEVLGVGARGEGGVGVGVGVGV